MQTLYFCPVVSFYLLFFIPRLISAAADWMSTILYFDTWCGLSANLECRSEMCCKRLAENTGRKNDAKNRHLRTIAQVCRAISSQLRHASTIRKKLVKQQYLLHMFLQYGELRPTTGWDRFVSLGYPANFNGFGVSAALLYSQIAALNRRRHLYSAGRPSRWALAHISSFDCLTEYKVTGSYVHCESGNISAMVQDRDSVTTDHW